MSNPHWKMLGEFINFRKKRMKKFCGLIRTALVQLKDNEQVDKSKTLNEYIQNNIKPMKIQEVVTTSLDDTKEIRFMEALQIAKALEQDLDFNRA